MRKSVYELAKENPVEYKPGSFSMNHLLSAINQLTMKPIVIIVCGIPTSGKSTWAEQYKSLHNYYGDDFRSFQIVSRDHIRENCFEQPYVITKENEKEVTRIYDRHVQDCMRVKRSMILDNTHCKDAYLKIALKVFEDTDYSVRIKFFDIPLWKAYYRNIKRKLQTGKWIPISVIKAMKKNYDKINKKEYGRYNFL